MGGKCGGSGEPELWWSIRPNFVKEFVDSSPAGRKRGHQPLLALAPVSEVLTEFRGGIQNERPVSGAKQLELPPAEPLDAIQVRSQRPWIRRDEDASFAENGVPGQRRRSADEGQMIPSVAGGEDRLERANNTAPSKEHIDLTTRCRHGGLGVALA
jgi:hypothetical protein